MREILFCTDSFQGRYGAMTNWRRKLRKETYGERITHMFCFITLTEQENVFSTLQFHMCDLFTFRVCYAVESSAAIHHRTKYSC